MIGLLLYNLILAYGAFITLSIIYFAIIGREYCVTYIQSFKYEMCASNTITKHLLGAYIGFMFGMFIPIGALIGCIFGVKYIKWIPIGFSWG